MARGLRSASVRVPRREWREGRGDLPAPCRAASSSRRCSRSSSAPGPSAAPGGASARSARSAAAAASIRGAGLDPRQSTAATCHLRRGTHCRGGRAVPGAIPAGRRGLGLPFAGRDSTRVSPLRALPSIRGAGLTPASGARATASLHVSPAPGRVPPREWRGAPGLRSGPSGAAAPPPPPGSPAAWSGSSARVAYIMYRCERAGRGVRARELRSARQSPAPGSPAPRMDRGHGDASPGRGALASSAGRRSPFPAGLAGRRTPTPRRGGPPFGGGTPRVSQPRASPFAARDSPRRRGPRRTARAATCRSGRTAATGPRSGGG